MGLLLAALALLWLLRGWQAARWEQGQVRAGAGAGAETGVEAPATEQGTP